MPRSPSRVLCTPAISSTRARSESGLVTTPANAIRAIQITSRFPEVHGAPVHFGDPAAIGIADVLKPEYGGWATIPEGDVSVYWACGITPQVAIEHAKPSFCITHKAGHMLITDRLNAEFATL